LKASDLRIADEITEADQTAFGEQLHPMSRVVTFGLARKTWWSDSMTESWMRLSKGSIF
jgi:hypothetical protein